MSSLETIAIIGAGVAGISGADSLRRSGYTGRIVIVGTEPLAPYDRPPLSKDVLTAVAAPNAPALRPPQWYQDNHIELLIDAVTSVYRVEHELLLAGGRKIRYERLMLATGSRARTLPNLETGPAPCLYLRTFSDALRIREYLGTGRQVVIVGAGVIGLEVAASAVTNHSQVAVVELADRVMTRTLTPEMSRYIEEYHRSKGVVLHLGARIAGQVIDGPVSGLQLQDGQVVPADVIIAGVGIVPNSDLAQQAGLICQDGVVVDEFGATSDADIFAVGDVARYPDSFYGVQVRCENWMHAEKHAGVVARNMLGGRIVYRQVPFMWSDQYDLKIQVTGLFDAERHVLRGSIEKHAFVMFHLRGGQLVGATGINQPRDITMTQKLIEAGINIDAEKLADAKFNLRSAIPR